MIVADASALFKLIVKEDHSKFVDAVFLEETSLGEPIIAPDVMVSEVLNILWVDYTIKKTIRKDAFDAAIINFDKIVENLDIIPAKSLKDVAIKISVSKNVSVYDSMYIASSLFRGASLLSFDGKMCKAAADLGIQILTEE
jgi:predicted nucleic acid-binding protein